MATHGTGAYQYKVVEGFFKRPKKWPFMEVAGVATDNDDNVYVFNRGPYAAIMVFDKAGYLFMTIGDRQWPSEGDLAIHPAQNRLFHYRRIRCIY